MDITNEFVLDFARSRTGTGGAILDHGCGDAGVVAAGLQMGLDIYGADVFYAGSTARAEATVAALWGTRVREISGGRLPFPDDMFTVVASNQVFEHVEDLDGSLGEIYRVLKPGGTLISLFPSLDVIREGHIGIPMTHWMKTGTKLRFAYTYACRCLGAGRYKEQSPTARQWTTNGLAWIDKYTVYRRRSDILRTFDKYFVNELREEDYIKYRLRDRPWRRHACTLMDVPVVSSLLKEVFRKLAFLVIISRKVAA